MAEPIAASWDARFSTEDYVFGTEPNHWLAAHAACWAPGARVLCVADGEGRNSVWLARQGLVVDAFDVSAVGVEKARKLAAAAQVQVRYEQASTDGYAWPVAALDGVAAIFVQFADPAMRARMFERIKQSLKPGGTLILQGYTAEQLAFGTGGPREVSHLYTEDMIRSAFGDMELVALDRYERVLDEGAGHRGPSALLGLVARRR